jgi:hypothetical protein
MSSHRHLAGLYAIAGFLVGLPLLGADERLKDIACRSVHLRYPAPAAVAFYNEVTVAQSAPGTYFAVCGWDMGYYGIQELGNGKKLLIFSVWDSGQNDPKAVARERRVQLLHKDAKVRVGRFGGEGTGGQSFFDYDWQAGQTYRFLVTARPNGERTEYSAHFYIPEDKAWKHLVTFSTITGGKPMSGYYSFVEDFKRDKVSGTKARTAAFGNGWVRTQDERWVALTRAQFTADSNPATNIDAAVKGGQLPPGDRWSDPEHRCEVARDVGTPGEQGSNPTGRASHLGARAREIMPALPVGLGDGSVWRVVHSHGTAAVAGDVAPGSRGVTEEPRGNRPRAALQ